MKGEFSRLTFDPRRHFSGTLWQQGRVGSDADWNEWVEQVLYRFRKETIDVIGGCGRPQKHPGFTVSLNGSGTPTPSVQLSSGRLYAGGMLAELEKAIDFMAQYDWPIPSSAAWTALFPGVSYPGLDFNALTQTGSQVDLFYVEVWLRHVTALIDEAERQESIHDAAPNPPDWNAIPEVGTYIRERALGGPDTCTRLQTVAQVKRWPVTDPAITTCEAACAALGNAVHFKTLGAMQVNVPPTAPVTKPCDEPQIGGYGGAENRAYRVEVHDPGAAGTATFKWSFENGAFLVPVINVDALSVIPALTSINVQTIGNDQITKLRMNDWVEMCGEETELGMWRNPLAQLAADPTGLPDGTWQLQLKGPASVIVPHAPFLRRWSDNTQTIVLNMPFNLDAGSGLSVTFYADTSGGVNPANTYFREMDYWMWAARTLSRDIEPPDLANTPQEVRGIIRHKCCLALITWATDGNGNFSATSIDQCPDEFPPLTDIPTDEGCCCCTITAGDGKTSQGQYSDIPSAVAALTPGSRLCIKAGDYTVDNPIPVLQDNVIIEGCGAQTNIHGPNGIFTLTDRTNVEFRELNMDVMSAPAIDVFTSTNVRIISNHILANQDGSTFALSVQGKTIEIRRNFIAGGEQGNSGGGIEVRGLSSDVRIEENLISGGDQRGITLGSLEQGAGQRVAVDVNPKVGAKVIAGAPVAKKVGAAKQPPGKPAPAAARAAEVIVAPPASTGRLQNIVICHNRIQNTGLEGIGVPRIQALTIGDLGKVTQLLSIFYLTITDNSFQGCGNRQVTDNTTGRPLQVPPSSKGIISLEDVEFCEISRNSIQRNGRVLFASGIYIALAAGARIHDNIILANGSTALSEQFGDAGGISLSWVVPPPVSAESNWPSYGWAAASICDNVVLSQASPALRVLGAGPMIVSRNRFTTENLPAKARFGGGIVMIENLGIDDEYAYFLGLQNMTGNAKINPITTGNLTLLEMLLRVGGELLFAENQCLLDGEITRSFSVFPILAFTLDDLGFSSNQVRVRTARLPLFPLLVGALLFGLTVRIEDNRFKETAFALLISCYGIGLQTIGTGNMATHCLFFGGLINVVKNSNLINPIFQSVCEQAGAGGV